MSRKSVQPKHYILTANDLLSGDIVFWSRQGQWSRRITDALLSNSPEEQENLSLIGKEQEQINAVIGAYTIGGEVKQSGLFEPVALREIRRIQGPSILSTPQFQQAA